MNIPAFIDVYNGKEVPNNGGAFPGECVSLAARFSQEQQGIPNADSVLYCAVTGGARDLYENPTAQTMQHYDKLSNTDYQPGDLIIWGTNRGKYGHVAIYIGDNQVFQQLGTPVFKPAAVATLKGIVPPLGYLRKKGSSMTPQNVKIDHDMAQKMAVLGGFTTADKQREPEFYASFEGKQFFDGADTLMRAPDWGREFKGSGSNFKPYSGPPLFEKG